MQLSEMRYITGIITQGAGKIAGYSLAEPTGEIRKPDIVMAKDVATYLKSHNCKIINANVDAAGQVTFRSKADQESYVTLNSSGYVLGWPKKPLPKLHEGNKTGGKTGEVLRPTHSYIVVDINETENVAKVMNLGGMVKPMTLGKLKTAISEGLIVSNVEVANGNIKLLSQGMDELLIGKAATPQSVQSTQQQTAQAQPKVVIPPISMGTTPIKPPATAPTTQPTPIKPPVAAPTTSNAVIPPVSTPKPTTQTTPTPQQAQTVQAALRGNQTSITPNTKTVNLDFDELANEGYDFENRFLKEYAGQKVRIVLDLSTFAPAQFEVHKISGKNYLFYGPLGTGRHDLQYFESYHGRHLEAFLNIFNEQANRESLHDTKVVLMYDNKLIDGLDYRMLYMERGFLNFGYLVDWNVVDLYHLSNEEYLRPKFMSSYVSLLLLPNKVVNAQKNEATDVQRLYGRFYAHYHFVWSNFVHSDSLKQDRRYENLIIRTHPRAKISEMADDSLYVFLDYPFGMHEQAYNCIIDLTNTTLRFIAKNAIRLMHGANYEICVPASCKRVHDYAFSVYERDDSATVRLDDASPSYGRLSREYNTSNTTISKATTITLHGSNIERIDEAGNPYPNGKQYRAFIRVANWSTLLNLSHTTIAFEDLPQSKEVIDLAPYCYPDDDVHLVDNWYTIGDWSDIGKGKLSLKLCSKPKAIDDKVNLKISGTATKVKLELYNERQENNYNWPVIEHLYVEEGVEELEIVAATLRYRIGKGYTDGYLYNYIRHLILPASLKSIVLKVTTRNHSDYVKYVYVADNTIMAKLDLKEQFRKTCVAPLGIIKYANARTQHDKNLLSDLMGTDMTHVPIVEFNDEAIKRNLAFCGITL